MSVESISIVVAGGLGTDVIALGLSRLIGPGELEFGGNLQIGAGGKSRNIAQMMANLIGPGRVAMVGRTSQDPLSLWRVPVDALKQAGVNVDFTRILPYSETGKFPQIALIAVDTNGNNQIYVVPGVNADFCGDDIEAALPAFQAAERNKGLLVLSLELPLKTAVHAITQANACGLRVVLDPGGIREGLDYSELLAQDIFLIKPNEHEASILTGLPVATNADAEKAARHLLGTGIKNVLITLGARGALLVDENGATHLPIPDIESGAAKDETGCGDQTMASLCSSLIDGADLRAAARDALVAGTMQFHRAGIVPVTRAELDEMLRKLKEKVKAGG